MNQNTQEFDGAYIGIFPNSELVDLTSAQITTPLGQLIIGSYICSKHKNILVKIFSLDMSDQEKTLFDYLENLKIDPEKTVIGFTGFSGTIRRISSIKKRLSDKGYRFVVGGPEIVLSDVEYQKSLTGQLGDMIYFSGLSPEFVDTLFSGKPTPGHFYSDDSCTSFADIISSLRIDYSLLNDIRRRIGVSYLWRLDCHQSKRRCYFCGRPSFGDFVRPSELVWEEISSVFEQFGISKFYNVADSILMESASSFVSFLDSCPKKLLKEELFHRFFVNSHHISTTAIASLKKIPCLIAIGAESFSLFHQAGKQAARIEDIYDALDDLTKAVIPVNLSFVFGLPGESSKTMDETCEFILSLVKKYRIIWSLEASPLTVTVGSNAYHNLLQACNIHSLNDEILLDPISLSTLHCEKFCQIKRESILSKLSQLFHSANDVCFNQGRFNKNNSKPDIWFDVKGINKAEKDQYFKDIEVGRKYSPYSRVS